MTVDAEITSLVIYGTVEYKGTETDGILVTINLTYNATTYESITDTTYGGGKYQVDLSNMNLAWNSSMTVKVNATYGAESDSNTFSLTPARTNDGLHQSNLELGTATTGDDDDDDSGSSSSSTTSDTASSGNDTTYIVVLGALLVFGLIFGLGFMLFESKPSMPMPNEKKKPVKKDSKKNKKSYTKSGVTMEEYSYTPKKKKKIRW
jgi:hypothetical protein